MVALSGAYGFTCCACEILFGGLKGALSGGIKWCVRIHVLRLRNPFWWP